MKLLIDFPELAGFAREVINKPLDLTLELYQRSKAIVHLAKIEQAHEALKKVEIKDIHFEEDLMLVDFDLKKG